VTGAGNPLEEVLSLCEAMLASAREQDWVTVANLEATRGVLLNNVLADQPQPLPEWLARSYSRILDCDRELMKLGEVAHVELAGKILQFRHSQRAQAAYSDAGGE
jgi:Flagellar protein FliT